MFPIYSFFIPISPDFLCFSWHVQICSIFNFLWHYYAKIISGFTKLSLYLKKLSIFVTVLPMQPIKKRVVMAIAMLRSIWLKTLSENGTDNPMMTSIIRLPPFKFLKSLKLQRSNKFLALVIINYLDWHTSNSNGTVTK